MKLIKIDQCIHLCIHFVFVSNHENVFACEGEKEFVCDHNKCIINYKDGQMENSGNVLCGVRLEK